jgi:hypothetical protein
MEACADVETYCNRKFQLPASTQVKDAASAGATSFTVKDCNGIYESDVAVFSTGEVVEVTGVAPNYTLSTTYSATVYLATALSNAYSANATVTFYRQCTLGVRGHATEPGDQANFAVSPEGQIAVAHAGGALMRGNSRILFVEEYPLYSVFAAYQALPWGSTENPIDLSGSLINRHGTIRLALGRLNPTGSQWRIQYTAGMAVAPQDIRDAAYLYLADKLTRPMNPMGAVEIRNADEMVRATRQAALPGEKPPASLYVEQAERKLERYRRKGIG